jgi:hypothetical protein
MQNKTLFGFAAAILILVIAAASFFAGLYLGQRGYVADLQVQSQNSGLPAGNPPQSGPFDGAQGKPLAGQPNQGGLNPAGGPPGAPSWPPDVMGRLVSLTADAITLDTQQGQVTVALSSSITYLDEAGNPIPSSNIKAGDVVAVFGHPNANIVMRLPPRPGAQ